MRSDSGGHQMASLVVPACLPAEGRGYKVKKKRKPRGR